MEKEKLTWDDLIEDDSDEKEARSGIVKEIVHYTIVLCVLYLITSMVNLGLLGILLTLFYWLMQKYYRQKLSQRSSAWKQRRILQARRNSVRDYEDE